MIKRNQNLMSINHTAKKRTKKDIEFIVIHYVGALGDAKANTDYYKSDPNANASADLWVGFNGDVWQGNDYYNYYSWHCGGGLQGSNGHEYYQICKNGNSIGIEMCVRYKGNYNAKTAQATDENWYFEQATIDATAELVSDLMNELEIDIDHVIMHYSVTGKYCPSPFLNGNHSWSDFKKKILSFQNKMMMQSRQIQIKSGWDGCQENLVQEDTDAFKEIKVMPKGLSSLTTAMH